MTVKEKERAEKIIEAGEAATQAGQKLLDYVDHVEEVLDTKEDTLRMQELIFIKARYYRLKTEWKTKAFDYLAVSGKTVEEIRAFLSGAKNNSSKKG